jgi:thymidylate synthase (FAD)
MRPVTPEEILASDPALQVVLLQAYPEPEKVVYQAAKCDYSEKPVHLRDLEGIDFGKFIVDELLGNERGHWGPLEHPHITLSVSGFVHNVIVQARTHRVGISFDVQSQRYTGRRVVQCAEGSIEVDDLFYFRLPGYYLDRQGAKYEYTQENLWIDMEYCYDACVRYKNMTKTLGYAEEHARDLLPQNIRQNFVVSFNLRSILHFLDLRSKKDAQIEIQSLCTAMIPHVKEWAPNVWSYYEKKRLYKARLAP